MIVGAQPVASNESLCYSLGIFLIIELLVMNSHSFKLIHTHLVSSKMGCERAEVCYDPCSYQNIT